MRRGLVSATGCAEAWVGSHGAEIAPGGQKQQYSTEMLAPPWERYQDGPTSLRWRMGGGEELVEEWLAFWWRLGGDERRAYLAAHPPPSEWKEWLSVVALDGPAVKGPKKTKYPS